MTLTTLSSKEFKSLFKWAFRRNRTIMIIYSIMLTLGMILNLYEIATDNYYNNDNVPITIAVYECGALFFTFVSALKTFSFLHNKRSVDLFGALPTNRTTMFLSHLSAGIASISLPFTVFSLLMTGICFGGEFEGRNTFTLCIFIILTALLAIIASYTFTALIAYCCGTIIDTAIVTVAANGIWVGMVGLYFAFLAYIIPGMISESCVSFLSALAPYGFGFIDIYNYMEYNISIMISTIAWQIVFTAGIFVLAAYAANKRKAESSQNGFAFSRLPIIIKAGTSIVAGGFIGLLAGLQDGSMYSFTFWYVIIAFAAFFILHLIFERGLKGRLLPEAIVFGSTSVAVIVLVFCMTYGLGIDTFVPNPNSVKSVTFDNVVYSEPENIKTVTEIHQLISDGIRDDYSYPYDFKNSFNSHNYNNAYTEEAVADPNTNSTSDSLNSNITDTYYLYVDRCSFDFNYSRKVGTNITRSYWISGNTRYRQSRYYDLKKMDDLIHKLYASEEYKKSKFNNIWDDEARQKIYLGSITLNYSIYTDDTGSYTTTSHSQLPTDDRFFKELCEAFKRDLLTDSDYFYSDLPTSTSSSIEGQRFTEIDIEYDLLSDVDLSHHYGYNHNLSFIIKDSYKNTLACLEKYDIKPQTLKGPGGSYEATLYDDNYVQFGFDGNIYKLQNFIRNIAPTWEYAACESAGVKDYAQWHKENYDDYVSALLSKASELHNKYAYDSQYKDSNYTNDYLKETNTFGAYFQIEDKIIDDLLEYSSEYVKKSLTENTTSDSDAYSESDIDKNTDTNSKSASEIQNDTDIKTESKTTESSLTNLVE